MRTALRQRYYQDEELDNQRRPFSAYDNAFTLNRGGYTATYPDYSQSADAAYSYNLNDANTGERTLTMPQRPAYGYVPVREAREERQRRIAAHNRLYEGRLQLTDQPAPDTAQYDSYTYQDTGYENNYSYDYDAYSAQAQTPAYNTSAPAYNSVRQEVAQDYRATAPAPASRYSYYRPEFLDENNPARSIADNYKAKHEQKEEDLRPSNKTMQYAPGAQQVNAESKTKLYDNVSEQAKARPAKVLNMLTVYATLFIIIAILIATAAVMISTLIKDVSALEDDVAMTQSVLSAQEAELGLYQNNDYIYSQAKGLGMVDGAPAKTVNLLDVKSAEQNNETNWFDAVCDFLSNLLGS